MPDRDPAGAPEDRRGDPLVKTTCKECSNPPLPDCCRCKVCRAAHNARERARRAERKKRQQCWACGAKAVKVNGVQTSTCKAHQGHGWRQAS